MAKVLQFPTVRAPAHAPIVIALEHALEEARAGRVAAFALVCLRHDGEAFDAYDVAPTDAEELADVLCALADEVGQTSNAFEPAVVAEA